MDPLGDCTDGEVKVSVNESEVGPSNGPEVGPSNEPMVGPSQLRSMHETLSDFYPVAYLNAWAQGVRQEWAEFLDRVFKCHMDDLLTQIGVDSCPTVLDLGCGPSICNIMAASRISNRIYMADLLEGNRRELTKWINRHSDSWNWQPYFDFQGVLELQPDTERIEERVRSSVHRIVPCDLSVNQVFAPDLKISPFNIMICSLVWDVVAVNAEQLEQVIERSLNYLHPTGLLIVQGSLHEERYTVGSAVFPVLNIDKETLLHVFEKCNLQVVKWETRERCSTHYFALLSRKFNHSNSTDQS